MNTASALTAPGHPAAQPARRAGFAAQFPAAFVAVFIGAALALASFTAPAAEANEVALLRLAQQSGCMACHQVDKPAPLEEDDEDADMPAPRPPVAPAWRDVATKYRHRPDALQRLTATVIGGSNPYDSHWKYQIAGLAMPPNRVAISEADARRLVQWILSLEDPR